MLPRYAAGSWLTIGSIRISSNSPDNASTRRAHKTDVLDVQAIATAIQDGNTLTPRYRTGTALTLETWGRQYRRLARQRRHVEQDILNQMDRLWPGAFVNVHRFQQAHPDLEPPVPLVQSKPLERKLVQALLPHCPNPHDVLQFTEAEMIEFLWEYVGRGGIKGAQKVLRTARQALLPPSEVAAALIPPLHAAWEQYTQIQCQWTSLATQAGHIIPATPGAVLLSIPGLSVYQVAQCLAYVSDVARFASADQVWAYAGYDPIRVDNGDHHWLGQISKRGAPGFRNTLYLIGQSLARHCPPIRAAFQAARSRHTGYVGATIHAAHKANRLIFRLLTSQAPSDPPQGR
jgi:transposase